ncbi:hypothetical protein DPMN_094829 [Dreissena polymorpha]|uniref:Uncharacterized protein n=1 Tax=Dreissena polymorpha TaxID=45954 RepID=A0A9D4L6R0_DREPO|nr:hypothetical protein DPMN_094829 [Dreissena polymorpha]
MAKSDKGADNENVTDDTEPVPDTKSSTEKRRKDILYGKGEYRILGKKGEGTFSEVLKCQNIKDGSYWACKKMKQTYDR